LEDFAMLQRSGFRALGAVLVALGAAGPLTATAQERPVVAIDAGHGGDDVGVADEGLLEKDLVLQIAFVVGSEFVKAGYDVVFTRSRDEAMEWSERRRIAEQAEASALLMLHANGDEDRSRHGAEIFVYLDQPRSQRLARAVADAFRESGSDAVVEDRQWTFLISETVPSVMLELAFLTHPVERQLLLRSGFQHDLGRSLVAAVDALRSGG
jgi:N-acetylmuramoyl-L-alanine amidase